MSDLFVGRGKAGQPLTDVLVIDCHCHLGPTRRFRIVDSSADSLIRVMDLLGIDIAAPSAIPACSGGLIRPGNDIVIDAVQRYRGRIFGYMSVNPQYPKVAARELERCRAAGLRGIKVYNLIGTPYDDSCYELIWEFAQEHNLPVLAHTWGEDLEQIEPHFDRYPNVTWIMAHAGAVEQERYAQIGAEYPNVYLQFCCSRCPRGVIEYFVAQGLEDKLLWGTDAPFLCAAAQLGRVLFAQISPEQKAKILGGNARRVLGLDQSPVVESDT